eukprot:GHRR01030732.1.p2 GENE.GHRR01030732.1~~GHRR01030732.1.p2  ORF type:complete len:112 (-),score=2.52 GHRR01030732.1:199-534(-)
MVCGSYCLSGSAPMLSSFCLSGSAGYGPVRLCCFLCKAGCWHWFEDPHWKICVNHLCNAVEQFLEDCLIAPTSASLDTLGKEGGDQGTVCCLCLQDRFARGAPWCSVVHVL